MYHYNVKVCISNHVERNVAASMLSGPPGTFRACLLPAACWLSGALLLGTLFFPYPQDVSDLRQLNVKLKYLDGFSLFIPIKNSLKPCN